MQNSRNFHLNTSNHIIIGYGTGYDDCTAADLLYLKQLLLINGLPSPCRMAGWNDQYLTVLAGRRRYRKCVRPFLEKPEKETLLRQHRNDVLYQRYIT